jgi:hypothetical protein
VFTTVAGILASAAAIVGGLVWMMKKFGYYFDKTQDQTDQEIEQQNQKDKQQAEESGRPV